MTDEGPISDFDIRQVLINAKPMICVQQSTQKIVWVNQLAESLFGCGIANGLIGKPFTLLIPEELRDAHVQHWEEFWQAPRRRLMAGRMLPCQRIDGTKFSANLVLTPCQIRNETCCVVGFIPEVHHEH